MLGRPSWIFDQNDFSYFWSRSHFLLSFESVRLSIQEKFKIDFQDGNCCGQLVLPIGTILAIFVSTSHLNASYQVMSHLAFRFRRISAK